MKKLAIALTVAAAAGLAVYALRRTLKHKAIREKVSDEGYETAYDILYPRRPDNFYKKLQYGPVLPD